MTPLRSSPHLSPSPRTHSLISISIKAQWHHCTHACCTMRNTKNSRGLVATSSLPALCVMLDRLEVLNPGTLYHRIINCCRYYNYCISALKPLRKHRRHCNKSKLLGKVQLFNFYLVTSVEHTHTYSNSNILLYVCITFHRLWTVNTHEATALMHLNHIKQPNACPFKFATTLGDYQRSTVAMLMFYFLT